MLEFIQIKKKMLHISLVQMEQNSLEQNRFVGCNHREGMSLDL